MSSQRRAMSTASPPRPTFSRSLPRSRVRCSTCVATWSRRTCIRPKAMPSMRAAHAKSRSSRATISTTASRITCAASSPPGSTRRCLPSTSTSSVFSCWVEVLELDAGVGRGEAPVDLTAGTVAGGLPCGDFASQGGPVGQPPVQALLGEHAQLDLGHVQPAPMLGGGVEFELVGQPLGLGGSERLVQRGGCVGVEVVLDQHDPLGVRVVDVDEVLDAVGPVDAGAPVADAHVPPAGQRLADQEQVAGAVALVLVVGPCRPARGDRDRRVDLPEQLAAGLVQAHLRPAGVVRAGVDAKHVLHAPHEVGVMLGWDAPALDAPRLQPVCFKACRTVSYEMLSTTSSSTSRSASSRNVHRWRPSGGALHARATRWASCSPSSLRRYSRAGVLRKTAAPRPAVTYTWRTRATVVGWTSNASAITASVQPGPASPWSALSKMRAWVRALAEATPCPIRVRSRARSWSDRATTYRLRMLGLLPAVPQASSGTMSANRTSSKRRLTRY